MFNQSLLERNKLKNKQFILTQNQFKAIERRVFISKNTVNVYKYAFRIQNNACWIFA